MSLKNCLKTNRRGEVKKMISRKGQSTLEYVIILTAIIGAVILAATRFVGPRVQNSMDSITQKMEDQVRNINFGNNAGQNP